MQRMEDAWKNFMATGSVTAYLDYKYGCLDETVGRIGTTETTGSIRMIQEKDTWRSDCKGKAALYTGEASTNNCR